MFGSKANQKSKTGKNDSNAQPLNSDASTCVIAKGTTIEGKFSTTENIRLDGLIKGDVKCEKRLVFGESGEIQGKIITTDSAIKGKINGEIKVSGTLHLHETAKIDGTIVAKKMIVDSGAQYSGDCKIGDQHFK